MAAVDRLHVLTQPHVARAEVSVHIMQPVGHGVDGIDDEAHLAVLNVVVLQTFITCPHMTDMSGLISWTCVFFPFKALKEVRQCCKQKHVVR